MSKALVTVILPVYNAMPFLPSAIDSLFRQSIGEFKLLLVDDGSSDGSGQYLESVKHPDITLIRKSNQGVGAARNEGLELCKTKYIALMDADDISLPDRLDAQLAHIEADPKCVMLGTQIDFLIGDVVQKGLPCATRHEEIEPRLSQGGGVVYPTLLFRTSVARRIGGFRLRGTGEEFDFCVRMSEHGKISNLPRVLYRYRLHRSSISMTKHVDLQRGSAYAKATALQRKMGLPEVSFDEFARSWDKRAFTEVLRERVKMASNMSYRMGRINAAEGHRTLAAVQMAIAAGLDPAVAMAHLRRIASGFLVRRRRSASITTPRIEIEMEESS